MFIKNIPQPKSFYTWCQLKKGKSGGICIYFRKYVPLKILKTDNLQERMTCELQTDSKICTFASL